MTHPAVRAWHIHLGAHKTATTHLQDTLAHHREDLLGRGIDYIPCAGFRPLAHRYSRPGVWQARLWPLRAGGFDRRLAALRQGPETVLISDEDLLGYSYDLLSVPLYARPKAMHLVRHIARKAGRTELFLGIRSFDAILPSAYAQTLKAVPRAPGTMDRIREGLRDRPPSWAELIGRIRATVPEAGLKVWRHEDYRHNWRAILNNFAGRDLGPLEELPPPQRTVSPSPAAVAEAERIDPALPRAERVEKVRAIYAGMPAGETHGRYAPLDTTEIALLRERYAEDLAEIERRWPGTLITV